MPWIRYTNTLWLSSCVNLHWTQLGEEYTHPRTLPHTCTHARIVIMGSRLSASSCLDLVTNAHRTGVEHRMQALFNAWESELKMAGRMPARHIVFNRKVGSNKGSRAAFDTAIACWNGLYIQLISYRVRWIASRKGHSGTGMVKHGVNWVNNAAAHILKYIDVIPSIFSRTAYHICATLVRASWVCWRIWGVLTNVCVLSQFHKYDREV